MIVNEPGVRIKRCHQRMKIQGQLGLVSPAPPVLRPSCLYHAARDLWLWRAWRESTRDSDNMMGHWKPGTFACIRGRTVLKVTVTTLTSQRVLLMTRVSDSAEHCLMDRKWLLLEEDPGQSWRNTLCCDFPDEWLEGDAHRQNQTDMHTFNNCFLAFIGTSFETSANQSLMPTIRFLKKF